MTHLPLPPATTPTAAPRHPSFTLSVISALLRHGRRQRALPSRPLRHQLWARLVKATIFTCGTLIKKLNQSATKAAQPKHAANESKPPCSGPPRLGNGKASGTRCIIHVMPIRKATRFIMNIPPDPVLNSLALCIGRRGRFHRKTGHIYVVLLVISYRDHGRCRGCVANCRCFCHQ